VTGSRDDIANLLADARLMIGYAVRAGRLNHQEILSAVRGLEDKLGQDVPFHDEEARLVAAMNLVARDIAPVTVVSLGSSWRPFPNAPFDTIIRAMFAFIALTIVVAVGYLTFEYKTSMLNRNNCIDAASKFRTCRRPVGPAPWQATPTSIQKNIMIWSAFKIG
jgi:hypothetical protein